MIGDGASTDLQPRPGEDQALSPACKERSRHIQSAAANWSLADFVKGDPASRTKCTPSLDNPVLPIFTEHTRPATALGLLDKLPRENRDQIYEYVVFGENHVIELHAFRDDSVKKAVRNNDGAAAQTSKAVRSEMLQIYNSTDHWVHKICKIVVEARLYDTPDQLLVANLERLLSKLRELVFQVTPVFDYNRCKTCKFERFMKFGFEMCGRKEDMQAETTTAPYMDVDDKFGIALRTRNTTDRFAIAQDRFVKKISGMELSHGLRLEDFWLIMTEMKTAQT